MLMMMRSICASSKFDLKAGVPRYSGARLPTRTDARVDEGRNSKSVDGRTKGKRLGKRKHPWEKFLVLPRPLAFCLVWGLPPF